VSFQLACDTPEDTGQYPGDGTVDSVGGHGGVAGQSVSGLGKWDMMRGKHPDLRIQ